MINLDSLDIKNLLPQSLKKNKDIDMLCDIFNEEIENLYNQREKLFLFNLESQSDEVLNEMIIQEHVDYFETFLSREQKIDMIKTAFRSHLKKGTLYAVESNLDIIFNKYTLEEWFELKSEPFTFKLKGDEMPSLENMEKIFKAINEYKNVRSRCLGFVSENKSNIRIKTKSIQRKVDRKIDKFNPRKSFKLRTVAFANMKTDYRIINYREVI